MSRIPDINEAWSILNQYNQEAFHLKHARIVSGVLGYFAREYDPERVDYWEVAGLLHDLDFEQYPEQHCIKSQEIMRGLDLDEQLIRSVASHCYGLHVDIRPEHIMEKILYAVDELTGLIGAVAIMRPSKSVSDLEQKSVLKKFKTPSFAAGCSRDIINQGCAMLGWELGDLIDRTIMAMRSLNPELEL
ncbi:MAG TPA: hydrolase [Clostridiales bacterium]|nr:hydrolase [Clostridiales bacterium]